ncbi:class D sortase [Sutcliffiella rhizosphaerae]|uniref:Sortase D n=1 Tax=Sutcliffiella rhizosphaerae TaxID=2880967 RepID=A0ABM8YTE4_9BACI|nr:class D sortase [Sutcliffiella rhizosphaerae]CAG9623241.1 Sortase D [Sutcliffiella rhizosphaerae]
MKQHLLKLMTIVLFISGAALFVGGGLLYWKGYSAIEERANEKFPIENAGIATDKYDQGEQMGDVFIPRLKEAIPIFHGVSEDELQKGVGFVPKSHMPGEGGHIVLSGHRDTVFRRLGELEIEDKIILEFQEGTFTYKINTIQIVDKEDRSILVPKPREELTILTCYPFRYIGSAPERYVIKAIPLERS